MEEVKKEGKKKERMMDGWKEVHRERKEGRIVDGGKK